MVQGELPLGGALWGAQSCRIQLAEVGLGGMTGLEVGWVVVGGWVVVVGWEGVGLVGMTGREEGQGLGWPRGWRALLVLVAPHPETSSQNLSFFSKNSCSSWPSFDNICTLT